MLNQIKTNGGRGAAAYVVPAAVGTGTVFALLCLFSLLMQAKNFSDTAVVLFAIFSSAAGSFICGLLIAHKKKKNGFLAGIIGAIIIWAFFSFAGIIMGNVEISAFTFLKPVVMILSGGIGGIIGVNRALKRKVGL